ncbi:hypothetical protein F2Q68_00019936 [Brassica cretica]|uniref:Uncharacterized protein n=1 Tax=Brassica cretica TaxID=69181 RepID=A0A8S9FYD0_BRACR|nr:hypothetical protein F2Q68_00019936 [Brassica cretica]
MQARKRMMSLLKEAVLKKRALGEEFGEFFKIICGEGRRKSKDERVINESLRITTTVPLVLKKPDNDIQVVNEGRDQAIYAYVSIWDGPGRPTKELGVELDDPDLRIDTEDHFYRPKDHDKHLGLESRQMK